MINFISILNILMQIFITTLRNWLWILSLLRPRYALWVKERNFENQFLQPQFTETALQSTLLQNNMQAKKFAAFVFPCGSAFYIPFFFFGWNEVPYKTLFINKMTKSNMAIKLYIFFVSFCFFCFCKTKFPWK